MFGVRQARADGVSEIAVGSQEFEGPSPVVPLLMVVIGLAAAAIWFVWLPLIQEPTNAARSCEVYVLPSGHTKCVPYGKPGSWAAHQESLRRPKP